MIDDRQRELAAWAMATEGNFSVNSNGKNYIPRIGFTNTNKELVERFSSIVQCGRVYLRDRSDKGFKPIWEWVLSGVEGCLGDFLEELIPYLPIKKKQAELVLEYCRIRQTTTRNGVAWKLGESNRVPRQEEIYLELKELNRKGVICA